GETIVEAQLELPALKRFEPKIAGATVDAVDTRGKAMLTRFDNGLTLYSHNQLYGRWYTVKRPRLPATGRTLRVALHTATHSAILYSASDIEVLTEPELGSHPFLKRIGPDVLDPVLTADAVVDRLESSAFRNRSLGALYLDQSFIAGLGNYLRTEILWAAGLHPSLKPSALTRAQLVCLAKQTIAISKRSYRTRGLTVPPSLARSLKDAGTGYEARRFQVFGREDLPCRSCGTAVERLTVSSRNLFVCPQCQPA
ncbi:MAG: endonuclease VIII, partial [Woeseiaceae bacterium]|nr:endonuclease VIII [Woeseiaceae bacterium]